MDLESEPTRLAEPLKTNTEPGIGDPCILQSLTGIELRRYVKETAHKLIPESSQSAFTKDVIEDLEQLDESHLAGLGGTPEQVRAWQRLNH